MGGGGLRRAPDKALPAIAPKRIVPPIKVLVVAVSPSISQTQTGPSTTSASDKSVSSAAGTVREPIV